MYLTTVFKEDQMITSASAAEEPCRMKMESLPEGVVGLGEQHSWGGGGGRSQTGNGGETLKTKNLNMCLREFCFTQAGE